MDERSLFLAYRRDGDQAAREEIVERFLPLARRLARRYQGRGQPLEDLEQVACLGLLKAIERFDPARRNRFASFAVPSILGELRRYFRDSGWAMHVPRELQERAMRVSQAVEALSGELGRTPSVAQTAESTHTSEESVIEAMEVARSYQALPFDQPATVGEDGDALSAEERIGSTEEHYEVVELGASIAGELGDMPERNRRLLHMRYVEDLTQSEIAARLGISQMHVSRLLRAAAERFQAAAAA
jgi:RNA polymerase sigma-B factor